MTIDRAIEILDPEHRECYDGMDEVNKACRMGMEALERTRWIPCSERLPENRDVWEQYTVLLCTYRPAWYGDDEYTVEKFVLPAEYNQEQKVWRVCGSGEIINALIEEKSPWRSYISHWMPMPEPPEEGGAADEAD